MLQAFLKIITSHPTGLQPSLRAALPPPRGDGIPDGRLSDIACPRLKHIGYDLQEVAIRQLMDHGTLLPVHLDLTQLAGNSSNCGV